LAVPVHHGGVGAGAGQKAGVEGGSLAEVPGKMNDANAFFFIEQARRAVAAAVVDRHDLGLRDGGSGLGDDGRHIFLLVEKGDDEREVGRHGLFPKKQGRHPREKLGGHPRSQLAPEAVGPEGNEPSVEHG